jgi:hypothetical protein
MKKLLTAVMLAATLVACGGGGGSDGSNVAKFVGDYRICDGDHVETFTVITEPSPGVLSLKIQDKVHEFKDCSTSGSINGIGWVDYPAPIVYTYTGMVNSNVYGIPSEFEYTTTDVTLGDITYAGGNVVVSGSGTVGQEEGCIAWKDGMYCVSVFDEPATIKSAGIVLSNGVLYLGLKTKPNTFVMEKVGIKQ